MKELQSGTTLLNRWGLLLVNHGPALNVLDFVWEGWWFQLVLVVIGIYLTVILGVPKIMNFNGLPTYRVK